ncbi:hypothetical protein LZ30DRAFT_766631 [Colletotrichum cereale]|nr:hypothetical protein LZ30DRAFT_766631 [Colletotrichum cereale]
MTQRPGELKMARRTPRFFGLFAAGVGIPSVVKAWADVGSSEGADAVLRMIKSVDFLIVCMAPGKYPRSKTRPKASTMMRNRTRYPDRSLKESKQFVSKNQELAAIHVFAFKRILEVPPPQNCSAFSHPAEWLSELEQV